MSHIRRRNVNGIKFVSAFSALQPPEGLAGQSTMTGEQVATPSGRTTRNLATNICNGLVTFWDGKFSWSDVDRPAPASLVEQRMQYQPSGSVLPVGPRREEPRLEEHLRPPKKWCCQLILWRPLSLT
jgi:hypothetical protein